MSVHMISYDLKGRDETASDYQSLIKAIKEKVGQGNYVKALYSQFFVDSNLTSEQWNSFLRDEMDMTDSRVIVKIESRVVGKFSQSAIDWLKMRGLV